MMAKSPKILLLDDDQELLDMYREILLQMPSRPEVHTALSGARAIALLETHAFTLLITDLNMPKMDGLQVISIVRRKYPTLRIVVLTCLDDEQFRSRAYAMGVDLFWQKPGAAEEIQLFIECIESLLGSGVESNGFRGVQSKSLIDLIQLECLSRSSTVLHITNGSHDGKIWIEDGEIIDATTRTRQSMEAFQEILAWRTGNFEILPFKPGRKRTIHESIHGLLLEAAQAIDEGREFQSEEPDGIMENEGAEGLFADLARSIGTEFLISVPKDINMGVKSWAAENVTATAKWVRETCETFSEIGEELRAGPLLSVECHGPQGHATLSNRNNEFLCAGWSRNLSTDQVEQKLKTLLNEWDSLDPKAMAKS